MERDINLALGIIKNYVKGIAYKRVNDQAVLFNTRTNEMKRMYAVTKHNEKISFYNVAMNAHTSPKWSRMVYEPGTYYISECYNLWSRWPVQPIDKNWYDISQISILDFLFRLIANNDQDTFDWLINWFKCILSARLRRVALVLNITESDLGYNVFVKLVEMMLGCHVIHSNITQLSKWENILFIDKSVTILGEVPYKNGDKYWAMMSTLKHRITVDHMTYKSGINEYKLRNCNNLLFVCKYTEFITQRGQFPDNMYYKVVKIPPSNRSIDYWDMLHKRVTNPLIVSQFMRYVLEHTVWKPEWCCWSWYECD